VDPWESWCPRQDLNWVSPKYKAEALPLDPTFQLQKKKWRTKYKWQDFMERDHWDS